MTTHRVVAFLALVLAGLGGTALRAEDAVKRTRKAGEWVVVRSTTRLADASVETKAQYWWVDRVVGDTAYVHIQELGADGTAALASSVEVPMDRVFIPMKSKLKVVKVAAEELKIAGKAVACERVERVLETRAMKVIVTSWTSESVPALGPTGAVRWTNVEAGQETSRVEVTDFGASGGVEKPVSAKKLR